MRCLAATALLPAAIGARLGHADPAPVIGGTNAPSGKWPDAAAILYNDGAGHDGQACSGVLVAPTIVLTAGHCNDPSIGTLDNVLVGTNSLAHPSDGETIGVAHIFEYPDSQTTIDVTALVLAHESSKSPRAIATGWARLDIVDGAAVELVGYGAIDQNGNQYVDALQQAQTTITDFDCAVSSGCNVGAQPDGELGAGGMGIDTCPGDSGGPLYLLTSYGAYLAGVTSRSYADATTYCGGGGIYERPDKIVDWIEQTTGVKVHRGPEPKAGAIHAKIGNAGETTIAANDPLSKTHDFVITMPPAQGSAAVRDDGRVRVCVDPAASPGDDSITLSITDTHDASRALALTIPIAIAAGSPPAMPCDPEAFSEGGGCCDSSGGGGSLALAVLVIVSLRWPRPGSSAARAETRSRTTRRTGCAASRPATAPAPGSCSAPSRAGTVT
jgi:secreted trypsin-like serine protease